MDTQIWFLQLIYLVLCFVVLIKLFLSFGVVIAISFHLFILSEHFMTSFTAPFAPINSQLLSATGS